MPKTAITGLLVSIDVRRDSALPLHHQISNWLKAAIQSGQLPQGSKLPSTRVFADELGVSRNTVLQVFEILSAEGLLCSRVGAGTYVARMNPVSGEREVAVNSSDHSASYPFRSLSRRGKSLVVSATGEFAERPTTFMPDLPDLREFPIRTWLRLLNETSGRLTGQILAEASNAGYEPLRRAIAQHVSASRGMKCESRQVIVTSGSQQGLDLICRMLIDTGDPVWLDEPGYRGAQSVLKANGAALCPWPMHRGIPDAADALAGHPTPRLIFVAPSRHYPLGTNISLEQRKVLLDIAHRSGAWIVEDDYDNEFIYDGNGLRSIFGMDTQARTIYMGTFSKTLLPSFRLGYLVVPNDLSEHFARARAVIDRHASLIEQMVLSEFMNKGLFASHIRRMRNLYQHRRAHLVHGLEELFGYDCRTGSPAGGTHVILPLIREAADHEIVAKAASRNIVLRALSPYYMTSSCEQGLLLGFSAFNETEIAKGLHALSGLRAEILPYVSVGFRA